MPSKKYLTSPPAFKIFMGSTEIRFILVSFLVTTYLAHGKIVEWIKTGKEKIEAIYIIPSESDQGGAIMISGLIAWVAGVVLR